MWSVSISIFHFFFGGVLALLLGLLSHTPMHKSTDEYDGRLYFCFCSFFIYLILKVNAGFLVSIEFKPIRSSRKEG